MFRRNRGFYRSVSTSEQSAKAEKVAVRLARQGKALEPVCIKGNTVARSFWGKAWCANLEAYSDYSNRLPRGRSYLRQGSVVHLSLQPGRIEALVSGSSLYTVSLGIAPLAPARWASLCGRCSGQIGTLVELLQGRLSDSVMTLLTDRKEGLFPSPQEIRLSCSCPDHASMCKHVAAVLYGVGARLDEQPALLFTLRSVNQADLAAQATASLHSGLGPEGSVDLGDASLGGADLGALFGIDIEMGEASLPVQDIPGGSSSPRPQPASNGDGKTPVKRRRSKTASLKTADPRPGTDIPVSPKRAALQRKAFSTAKPVKQAKETGPAGKAGAKSRASAAQTTPRKGQSRKTGAGRGVEQVSGRIQALLRSLGKG